MVVRSGGQLVLTYVNLSEKKNLTLVKLTRAIKTIKVALFRLTHCFFWAIGLLDPKSSECQSLLFRQYEHF